MAQRCPTDVHNLKIAGRPNIVLAIETFFREAGSDSNSVVADAWLRQGASC